MAFAVAEELADLERLKVNKSEHMGCPPGQARRGTNKKGGVFRCLLEDISVYHTYNTVPETFERITLESFRFENGNEYAI